MPLEGPARGLLPLRRPPLLAGSGGGEMRGAAIRVLAAMAHCPRSLGDTPAVAQHVASWRSWLLDTLCKDLRGAQHDALRRDCCEALTGAGRGGPSW